MIGQKVGHLLLLLFLLIAVEQHEEMAGEGFQHERDYVLSRKEQLGVYLSNNCRADGRELDQIKAIAISPDVHSLSCFGSSMIRWGGTIVSCNVTIQVGTPDPQSPSEGSIVFDAVLKSFSASTRDAMRQRKSSECLLIESTLSQLYNKSKAIDLTQLCIEHGKSAFALCIQIVCLSHDGSLLEACVLAVSAALARTVLPAVSLDGNMKIRITSPSRSRNDLAASRDNKKDESVSFRGCQYAKKLMVARHFVAMSVGHVFQEKSSAKYLLLMDPSLQELVVDSLGESGDKGDRAMDGQTLVVIDESGVLCHVQSDSCGIHADVLLSICDSCCGKIQTNILPLLLPLL